MARFFRLFFISSALVSLAACTHKSDENPNTLHLYEPEKITSLDPAHANDLYSHTEVSRVYEGLVQYHYLKRPFVLIPQLIDAMPALSADGKTYTFKIKKGVLFQDDPCFKETAGKGRELTAEDFVYSFKRIGDPATISSGWWIFDGKIAGFNEWHDQSAKVGTTDYAAKIEGLQATDRYTLQIKLTARSNQFLFNLAQSFASVVAKEAVDFYGAQFQNHPVGTGPFRLVEFNPNARMIYARNPTFHGENYPTEGEPGDKEKGYLEDAGKPLPFVDRVEVRVFIEDQPRWLTFMKGDLDYIVIPKDNYGQAFKDGKMAPELLAKGIREQRYPMLDITHLSFNMIDPVLGKNKLLRQALSIVYDQKKVNALFYNGLALEAQGPIPPGLSGYDPNFKDPYRQTNVEKAKELLAKAGYPDGKGLAPLEYLTQSGTTMRQWSEYDEKQFAQIGVKLKIIPSSWPEFDASVRNRKGQIYAFAWSADYPDAENFLQLFYSKNASPGPNDSNYSNPEYDRLYEKSLQFADVPERTAIYKQMVAILDEDCPWIFQGNRIGLALLNSWFKNYKYHAFEFDESKYVRIDRPVKK